MRRTLSALLLFTLIVVLGASVVYAVSPSDYEYYVDIEISTTTGSVSNVLVREYLPMDNMVDQDYIDPTMRDFAFLESGSEVPGYVDGYGAWVFLDTVDTDGRTPVTYFGSDNLTNSFQCPQGYKPIAVPYDVDMKPGSNNFTLDVRGYFVNEGQPADITETTEDIAIWYPWSMGIEETAFKDDSGTYYVFYRRDPEYIYSIYSTDEGETWSTGSVERLGSCIDELSVMYNIWDDIVYLWYSDPNAKNVYYRYGVPGSTSITWLNNWTVVTGLGDNSPTAYMTLDSDYYPWFISQVSENATQQVSFTTTPDFFRGYYTSASWYAQTFTTSSSFNVTSVVLNTATRSMGGTFYTEIWATNATGYPTGSALTSGSVAFDYNSLIPSIHDDDFPNWYKELEVMVTEYQLSASTKYALVFHGWAGGPTNRFGIGGARNLESEGDSDPYSGGEAFNSSDSGGNWTSYDSGTGPNRIWEDVNFQFYSGTNKRIDVIKSTTKPNFTADTPVPLDSFATDWKLPKILIGRLGQMYAFWFQESDNKIYWSEYDPDADTWDSATDALGGAHASDYYYSWDVDVYTWGVTDYLYLAWQDGSDTKLRIHDGTNWAAVQDTIYGTAPRGRVVLVQDGSYLHIVRTYSNGGIEYLHEYIWHLPSNTVTEDAGSNMWSIDTGPTAHVLVVTPIIGAGTMIPAIGRAYGTPWDTSIYERIVADAYATNAYVYYGYSYFYIEVPDGGGNLHAHIRTSDNTDHELYISSSDYLGLHTVTLKRTGDLYEFQLDGVTKDSFTDSNGVKDWASGDTLIGQYHSTKYLDYVNLDIDGTDELTYNFLPPTGTVYNQIEDESGNDNDGTWQSPKFDAFAGTPSGLPWVPTADFLGVIGIGFLEGVPPGASTIWEPFTGDVYTTDPSPDIPAKVLFEEAAAALGFSNPRPLMMVGAMIVAIGMGFAVLILTGSMIGGALAVLVMVGGGFIVGVIPLWVVIVLGITFASSIYLLKHTGA